MHPAQHSKQAQQRSEGTDNTAQAVLHSVHNTSNLAGEAACTAHM